MLLIIQLPALYRLYTDTAQEAYAYQLQEELGCNNVCYSGVGVLVLINTVIYFIYRLVQRHIARCMYVLCQNPLRMSHL